ncbi:GspE/PulE family protein [Vibrio crassostreae]|uniref:GspE/PulE family protein n=1 Tax=Vibrio crassostreae TaxID=246167 RepID=UPI001B310A5A|nr:ATPase, T2SS/T4P/T4SS family [Vibrio crassostreae]
MLNGLTQKQIDFLKKIKVGYYNNDGQVCVHDEHASEVTELKEILQSSTTIAEGKFLGLEPQIIVVPKEKVMRNLLELGAEEKVDETEVSKLLNEILTEALDLSASDIHVIVTEIETIIMARIDGRLVTLDKWERKGNFGKSILSYAFIHKGSASDFSLKSDDDATFSETLTKKESTPKEYDWRLSQINTVNGAKATIRNLDSSEIDENPSLDDLGLSPGHTFYLKQCLRNSQGAILLSGPTGSGKTTTICSGLLYASEDKGILIHALEDPVEWKLKPHNIVQTRVDPTALISEDQDGYKDFSYYGKKLLRNDTDKVFIGEIRDHEVAKTLLRMANTGQVAVATLHCNSAIDIMSTLMDQMGVNPSLLGQKGAILALAHQRLIRKVCQYCGKSHVEQGKNYANLNTSDREAFDKVKSLIDKHFVVGPIYSTEEEVEKLKGVALTNIKYQNPEGCNRCNGGEKGRTCLFEMILLDDKARQYIRNKDLAGWEENLKSTNWPSIQDHGLAKVFKGIADIRTVESEVSDLDQKPLTEINAEFRERIG